MKPFLISCLFVLAGISLQAQKLAVYSIDSCDVTQSGIFFVNALGDVNLKFYTAPSESAGGPNSFSYEWTFTYADNSTSWSYDREPYIPVPCDNPIKHAYVKVSSATCFKEINKNWNPGICGTGGLAAAVKGSSKKTK